MPPPHLPAIGQPPHPPEQVPQEPPQICLPVFLSRAIFHTISATTAARIRTTIIEPIFAASQLIIRPLPFVFLSSRSREAYIFFVSFVASLYFLKNSMYTAPAMSASAQMKPITLKFPVNIPPIWLTHSATA